MSPTDQHADDHDLGLAHDLPHLATARRVMTRRAALGLFGAGGAGLAGAVLLGGTAAQAATSATPSETAGPYPADGSNGPDVLDDSGIVRYDIRKAYGSSKSVASGVALKVHLRILDASSEKPVSGAAVYLWHANRVGAYSLYTSGYTATNYLRGIQVADSQGRLDFQTVFPGCYDGRWPHIHFEVFPTLAAARTGSNRLLTSQLALPEHSAATVYKNSLYPGSNANLSRTSLSTDNVFRDGWTRELATMSGAIGRNYTANLAVYV